MSRSPDRLPGSCHRSRHHAFGSLFALAALAVCWLGGSALWVSTFEGWQPGSVTIFVANLAYIFLAGWLTAIFIRYQRPWLNSRPGLRTLLLAANLVIAGGLLLHVQAVGYAGPWVSALGSANLMIFAMLLGTWLVAPLKRPAELWPVCAVMAFADLFSVARGPTRSMTHSIEAYYRGARPGPPPYADFLLVKVPVPGLEQLSPAFGVADWIAVAFLTASALKFGINDNLSGHGLYARLDGRSWNWYLPAGAAGLALAVSLAQITGLFLPALPVVALVFLACGLIRHPSLRRLAGTDWLVLAVAGGMFAGLIGITALFE